MELYLKVRLACSGGMSRRQAAKHFNISRDSVAKMQGNRVKQSSGDDACKEIVIPSGDFSSEAQRVLSYPSGPAALAAYGGVQFQGASSSMRLIL